MSKVMVVEDDASLREIYSIRVTAEGYDVVSAGDGEEALPRRRRARARQQPCRAAGNDDGTFSRRPT